MDQLFDELRIGLASSDEIRSWSYGEVRKPETINYRTLKPEKEGLFDERIFGPQRDWECYCGKYKQIRYKGIICERCGVEVTRSQVRRERMGHIDLAAPVTHIWFFKGIPSQLSYLLDMSPKDLEKVIYFADYVVTQVDRGKRAQDLMELQQLLETEIEVVEEDFLDWERWKLHELEERVKTMEEGGAKNSEIRSRRRETDKDIKIQMLKVFRELIVLYISFDVFREMQPKDLIEQVLGKLLDDKKDAPKSKKKKGAAVYLNKLRRRKNLKEHVDGLTDKDRKDLFKFLNPQKVWAELQERYTDYFQGGMGAEAIRDLLESVDLENELEVLEKKLEKAQQRRKKAEKTDIGGIEDRVIKRMKVVRPFCEGKNQPTDLVLDTVPVIPPDLRPMVQLDGGRFATSDLNDLYRRVINRNNRLKRLLELNAPEIIVNNEKRMLQESVDALFDNGRRGKPVTGGGEGRTGAKKGRPLKSLSHMLKGKQGRFRQNLLGKRVDYSARSVVVIGPQLQLHQCGLPKSMALELFKPFVMRELVERDFATNIKTAKRMVERRNPQVWDILGDVIQEHPVLLNRAPTLHRLGIQAFEPILVEGKAIQIHPLVCEAFNADFDGDQMAVHLPLSNAAQAEARLLMLATNNVLSPASGHPIVTPSQDMVLGVYYMTLLEPDAKGAGRIFSSLEEAEMAFDQNELSVHAPIKLRVGSLAGSKEKTKALQDDLAGLLPSTAPESPRLEAEIAERVKLAQISDSKELTPRDPSDPNNKEMMPKEESSVADQNGHMGEKLFDTTLGMAFFNTAFPDDFPYIQKPGFLESDLAHERGIKKADLQRIIEVLIGRYQRLQVQFALDTIKELGFRFATRAGVTIALHDIKTPANKAEILAPYETRATTVQDNYQLGVFTRGEMQQELIEIWTEATDAVREAMDEAHHTEKFNSVDMMVRSGARGNAMQIRQLAGMRGMVVNPKGEIITRPIQSNFREGMSVLEYFISTHGSRKGLTDTALRTAAAGYLTRRLVDVSQELIVRQQDCGTDRGLKVQLLDDNHLLVRNLNLRLYGRVLSKDVRVGNRHIYTRQDERLAKGSIIKSNQLVQLQKEAAEIKEVEIRSPLTCDARIGICQVCYGLSLASGKLAEIGEAVGIMAAQSIGEPGTQLTLRTFHTGGVVSEDITHGLLRVIELFEARKPKGMAHLSDIKGVVRIIHNMDGQTEYVMVDGKGREPVMVVIPAGFNLRVKTKNRLDRGSTLADPPKQSGLEPVYSPQQGKACVLNEPGEHNSGLLLIEPLQDYVIYPVSRRAQFYVKEGDTVEPGTQLNAGPLFPKKVLEILGERATFRYLLEQIQDVYRSQGVEIHDKHIELIVRQMLRRVKVEEPNDTEFYPGQLVDEFRFKDENRRLIMEELKPAHGRQQLMGLIKASLATDSWLSAASFQETTRVLTEASVQAKSDYMRGLKESVIIGKLIPAGTGTQEYQRIQPAMPDATTIQSIGLLEPSSGKVDPGLPANPAEWLASLGEPDFDEE